MNGFKRHWLTQMENMLIISTFWRAKTEMRPATTALILVVLSGRRYPEAVSTICIVLQRNSLI